MTGNSAITFRKTLQTTMGNLNISGNTATAGRGPAINGILFVSGTFALNNGSNNTTLNAGSTATITGTISGIPGAQGIVVENTAVLGTGGTLSAPITFYPAGSSVIIPARVYNGPVALANNISGPTGILGAGSASFLGGLQIGNVNSSALTLDASINNPNVTVTTLTFTATNTGVPILNAGTGTWTSFRSFHDVNWHLLMLTRRRLRSPALSS